MPKRVRTDPQTFGELLDRERKAAGLTIEQLQEKVARITNGARGTSYSAIWTYLNGQGPEEPRHNVVAGLAEALGVLPDYLLTGERPRTEEEARMQQAQQEIQAAEDPEFERVRRIFEAMRKAENEHPPDLRATYYMGRNETLHGLVFRLIGSGDRDVEFPDEEIYGEAASLLAWLIMLPARALDSTDRPRSLPGFLSDGRGKEYFMAMAMALQIAMPERGQGSPLTALAGLRAAKEAWEARLPLRPAEGKAQEMDQDNGQPDPPNKESQEGEKES